MKLEVGMYVRTKWGGFFKLSYYDEKEKRWICVEKYNWSPIYESEVKKASHNIIDLIEVGDYVNGQLVYEYLEGSKIYLDGGEYGEILILEDGKPFRPIKTIVTKEQFENMSYKVGE